MNFYFLMACEAVKLMFYDFFYRSNYLLSDTESTMLLVSTFRKFNLEYYGSSGSFENSFVKHLEIPMSRLASQEDSVRTVKAKRICPSPRRCRVGEQTIRICASIFPITQLCMLR